MSKVRLCDACRNVHTINENVILKIMPENSTCYDVFDICKDCEEKIRSMFKKEKQQ